ncbi:hypothetical protein [Fusobacterium periodonticum]|nr:hypothetical protein [Fusobacterium periodonticum]
MENLIKFKTYRVDRTDDAMTLQTSAGVYAISEKLIYNFKRIIGIPSTSKIVSISATQSSGYAEYATYDYDADLAAVGHIVNTSNPRWISINVAYI